MIRKRKSLTWFNVGSTSRSERNRSFGPSVCVCLREWLLFLLRKRNGISSSIWGTSSKLVVSKKVVVTTYNNYIKSNNIKRTRYILKTTLTLHWLLKPNSDICTYHLNYVWFQVKTESARLILTDLGAATSLPVQFKISGACFITRRTYMALVGSSSVFVSKFLFYRTSLK